MKAKVGDLEEDTMEAFLRRLRKEMTGAVQEVVGKRRHSVMYRMGGRFRYSQISLPLWSSGVK